MDNEMKLCGIYMRVSPQVLKSEKVFIFLTLN